MDQYVLSLSYGKDSLACLGAIEKLGLPLDRIIHAEVWATDDIPADLPPMVEFKKKADDIIKFRWGIEVEHVYATFRGGCEPMNVPSMSCMNGESTLDSSGDSLCNAAHGVRTVLKQAPLTDVQKLTYEKIFYRKRNLRGGGAAQSTDSPWSRVCGATAISSGVCCTDRGICDPVEPVLHRGTQANSYYGFPISIRRGNWCTQLKTRVF